MCGRFSLALSPSQWTEYFGLPESPDLPARYNVAPGQDIPILREEEENRRLALLRWGLIPFWAKDKSIGNRMINARAESLSEKPAFRKAFKTQRCIIPASGFYEWQKTEKGKKPYYLFRSDRNPISLAGLWERWTDRETGEMIESCAIITTSASPSLKEIHDRMPVILNEVKTRQWLDPGARDTGELLEILESPGDVELDRYQVSDYVNSVRNDGERCIKPKEAVEH